MNNIKVALIGCGKQAPKHISGLRKVPGVEIVLTDVQPAVARELAAKEKLPWLATPGEVFVDPTIQAVDICTPTPTHAGLIMQALSTGKDFFCEKPLCQTAEEAHSIAAKITETGRIGMVGFVYRFAPVFELGHQILDGVAAGGSSPALGKIVTAFFRLGGRGSHQLWKHRRATGGGAISEMLVHMLDLAMWYFGPISETELLTCDLLRPTRMIQGHLEQVDAEDYVLVRLKTTSGVEVICQADLVTPAFTQFIEIQGENGTFFGSIQQDLPSFLFCTEPAPGYSAGKTSFEFQQHNLFEAQMNEFIQSVHAQHPLSPRGIVGDSIVLMDAVEQLHHQRIKSV